MIFRQKSNHYPEHSSNPHGSKMPEGMKQNPGALVSSLRDRSFILQQMRDYNDRVKGAADPTKELREISAEFADFKREAQAILRDRPALRDQLQQSINSALGGNIDPTVQHLFSGLTTPSRSPSSDTVNPSSLVARSSLKVSPRDLQSKAALYADMTPSQRLKSQAKVQRNADGAQPLESEASSETSSKKPAKKTVPTQLSASEVKKLETLLTDKLRHLKDLIDKHKESKNSPSKHLTPHEVADLNYLTETMDDIVRNIKGTELGPSIASLLSHDLPDAIREGEQIILAHGKQVEPQQSRQFWDSEYNHERFIQSDYPVDHHEDIMEPHTRTKDEQIFEENEYDRQMVRSTAEHPSEKADVSATAKRGINDLLHLAHRAHRTH